MVMGPLRKDVQRIAKAFQAPLGIQDILRPPLPLRIRHARTGIRQLDEVIDIYARDEARLSKAAELRLTELRILREQAGRRLAEMTRLRR